MAGESPQQLWRQNRLGDPYSRDCPEIGYHPEKRHCRWCWQPITEKRRSTWCGKSCLDEYQKMRAEREANGRAAVWERDQGVCAICGVDTQWLKQQLWPKVPELTIGRPLSNADADRIEHLNHIRLDAANWWDLLAEYEAVIYQRAELRIKYPWAAKLDANETWWQSDHIIPVASGGGNLGLTNLRTLCLGCHKKVTADFAGQRARLPSKGYKVFK